MKKGENNVMRDISNFGNNLRDEIIEYRLEHETGYTITIDLDNSGEDESSVITSKIYNTSGEELSESHISLDDIKMTAQNISMIADAESEEAKPTPVFVADVKDKKVTVHDLDVDNSINIKKAKIGALDVTGDIKANGISITAGGQLKIGDTILNETTLIKLVALAESMTETESK